MDHLSEIPERGMILQHVVLCFYFTIFLIQIHSKKFCFQVAALHIETYPTGEEERDQNCFGFHCLFLEKKWLKYFMARQFP